MTEKNEKWTRDQKLSLLSIALMVLFEVLNHTEVLSGVFGPHYQLIQPFIPFPLGIAVGVIACRSFHSKELAEIDEVKDALAHDAGPYKRGMVAPSLIDGLCADERRLVAQMYAADGPIVIADGMQGCAYRLLVMGALDNMSLYDEVPVRGSSVTLSTRWRAFIKNDADVRSALGL